MSEVLSVTQYLHIWTGSCRHCIYKCSLSPDPTQNSQCHLKSTQDGHFVNTN